MSLAGASRFALGVAASALGFLWMREAVWARAGAAVAGMRSVSLAVPGARAPPPLAPPPPPLPAGLDAVYAAATDALRGWQQ